MTGLSDELDDIFGTVSVCRSFRLNGLQEILKRTKSNIRPVTLIWQVGDLSARGYFDTSPVVNFIVNRDEARKVIPQLTDPTPQQLHEEWLEWYQEEFGRYFKADDLSELLFHKAAVMKQEGAPPGDILENLKKTTQDSLWNYYDHLNEAHSCALPSARDIRKTASIKTAFEDLASQLKSQQAYEEAQEVTEYLANLHRYIKELNRFDGDIFTPPEAPGAAEPPKSAEYSAFLDFLTSLLDA
jgi:hypothetical protein